MKIHRATIAAITLLAIGGCATAPTGPTVLVLPGTHRDFNSFRADEASCRDYAMRQISGPSRDKAVRNAVIGTAIGAAAGAAMGGHEGAGVGAGAGLLFGSVMGAEKEQTYTYDSQRKYDNAYIQCMYARGHRVPVPASMARSMMESADPVSSANYPPPPPAPSKPPSTQVPPDYVAPR